MKKTRIILFVAVAAILFSCDNKFLSGPQLPPGSAAAEREIPAPDGIRASQGEKRSITLTWNETPKAVLYYIYNAETPLDSFVRCGETNSTQFKFNVPPGSTLYYRVSSVSHDGTESVQSYFVRGTSLAQPMISDITGITESSSAVTWYMDNAFEDSYKDSLLYTVYCYNGSVEVAQIALDGSVIKENRAEFTNLAPNTRYEYQVEAYLRGDQSASEKSLKMDAATARRFRPGAPVNLKASRGTDAGSVTLSFELPDMVDIALGESKYDPKPLRFVISKRVYSESGNNEYQQACPYFGSIATDKGETFPSYIPGAAVTWSDTKASRGVKYEYLVQAYVDDTSKIISSDASKASAVGWALSDGNLSFGDIKYTKGAVVYEAAELPLDFEFDPQEVSYSYKLIEKIEPLGDDYKNDPDEEIIREIPLDSYDAVRSYIPTMDLTQKTTQDNPGRGVYSYAVEIQLNNTKLYTISALGKVEVSEDTNPIIVENFSVQDGYTNKFVLKWHNYSNRKYVLYTVDAKGNNPVEIGSVNNTPSDDANMTVQENFSYEYTEGVTTGATRYFAIRPFRHFGGDDWKQGQMVYLGIAARTMGVPIARQLDGNYSYSDITALWSKTQKADTYRVKFRYTGDTAYKTIAEVRKEALNEDAFGDFKYTFKPEGNAIDVAKAGKEIQIQVEALNEDLRKQVGGDPISTFSTEDVRTRLLGPALLNLSASKAASASAINVFWDKIDGAGGYYVFRRQFNMNNTTEEGTKAVVYYVPAEEKPTVTIIGKELLQDGSDTTEVKAWVTFADKRYALTDEYMNDYEYDINNSRFNRHSEAYRNQQNDMAQGISYRYYVVPVISDSRTARNSIEFTPKKDSSNKNTNIDYYTIQENGVNIKYTGADAYERDGFTIGFGQNVTATKGTYISEPYNANTINVNNGVKITWEKPPRLPNSGFKYIVYSRESGGSEWLTIATDVEAFVYPTKPSKPGTAYEYVIGITGSGGSSDPRYNKRFIDECYKVLDERDRPKMLGFMLDSVKMDSVSRNEQKVGDKFAEEVKWKSAGIKYRDGTGYTWGIDGYEVYVMNRNINAEWHKITEIPYDKLSNPNQIDQSVKVTTGMGSVTLNTTAGPMAFDLLRVMRDYKHFFKIRSYVLDGEKKIFCPDPNWTYSYQFGTSEADHIAKSNNMQNDYVKWGARQITSDEFIQIVSVYAGRGICDSGKWSGGSDSSTVSATYGGGGKVDQSYSYDANTSCRRTFKFADYKRDLPTRTGQSMTFITISGNMWTHCTTIYAYPFRYGEDGWVTVKGPWDTPDLYTGQIIFGKNKTGNTDNGGFNFNGNGGLGTSVSPGDGSATGTITARVAVKYPGTKANPGAAAEVQIPYRGKDTGLQFRGEGDTRYNLEHFK